MSIFYRNCITACNLFRTYNGHFKSQCLNAWFSLIEGFVYQDRLSRKYKVPERWVFMMLMRPRIAEHTSSKDNTWFWATILIYYIAQNAHFMSCNFVLSISLKTPKQILITWECNQNYGLLMYVDGLSQKIRS